MADEARISFFFSIRIHSPLIKAPSFIRVYSRPLAVDQGSLYSCPFAVLFSKPKETKCKGSGFEHGFAPSFLDQDRSLGEAVIPANRSRSDAGSEENPHPA
jgi:hypothetical protein